MAKQYYVLRILALFIRIFAAIVFMGAMSASCRLFQSGSVTIDGGIGQVLFGGTSFDGLLMFLGGILATVLLWAHAELIMVHIHTEENTREAAINSRRSSAQLPASVSRSQRNLWEEP